MANPEHLKILRQGVEVWNRWRGENPGVRPDLRGAKLSSSDLGGVDLSGSDLSGADLSGADFSSFILSASGPGIKNLFDTILSEADLSKADLSGVNFSVTNLCGVNLRGASLSEANLSGVNLSGSDLSKADLREADLRNADLRKANLEMVSFQTARLIDAKLDDAYLTDACLWETQRAGWSIKGIICESVYWDKAAQIKTTYAPGDFERLFAEHTKIKLFFKDGISPLEIATLPALIKHLQDAHPGCSLRLVSIHDDAGGAVVELAIEDDDERSPQQMKQLQVAFEAEAQRAIEIERKFLAGKEQKLYLEGRLEELRFWYREQLLLTGTHVHTQGGVQMSQDTYTISGQAGAVGPNAHAHDMTFNQLVNHVEQHIDLAELAKQLGELRQAMAQKQDTSPQADIARGEIAKAEIAATEKNPSKVVEHLKAAGKWTLDFAKDIGKDLVVDVIKKATGMQ